MAAETRVRRIGNSKGVILPADLLHELGIKEGDTLEVTTRDGIIVISKPLKDIFSDE